jgi:hypothetical protein
MGLFRHLAAILDRIQTTVNTGIPPITLGGQVRTELPIPTLPPRRAGKVSDNAVRQSTVLGHPG